MMAHEIEPSRQGSPLLNLLHELQYEPWLETYKTMQGGHVKPQNKQKKNCMLDLSDQVKAVVTWVIFSLLHDLFSNSSFSLPCSNLSAKLDSNLLASSSPYITLNTDGSVLANPGNK